MRGMESESIDLIYLDPPFNSKHDYSAPIGSKAAGAEFKDTWTLSDIDVAWWGEIQETNSKLYQILGASGTIGGKSVKSYLIYMAIRILEMHRILKFTGSLYLHCDPTMSHYVKIILDAVFGAKNFRNEIIWKRAYAHNDTNQYGRIHDVLLYYTKSDERSWNPTYDPPTKEYINKYYKKEDERGRYWTQRLDGAGSTDGESGQLWKDVDPGNRHWAVPTNLPKWFKKPKNWEGLGVHKRLDILDEQGLVYWSRNGKPSFKQYLETAKGTSPQDLLVDKKFLTLVGLGSDKKEDLGYPTQKPLSLLEYIISNSSDYGSWVFDPFCGCATACQAAERLGRKWIGCDISEKAHGLIKGRLKKDAGIAKFITGAGEVIHRTDIPKRQGMRSKNIKHTLYGMQEGECNGCHHWFEIRHFEVDHIIPKAKGGHDDDSNLQLLCSSCNRIKGKKPMEYLRVRLEELD